MPPSDILHSLFECDPRTPTQLSPDVPAIERDSLDLAGSHRTEERLDTHVQSAANGVEDSPIRHFLSPPEVERFSVRLIENHQVRLDDVANVHVVPGLGPVPEDRRRFTPEELPHQNGYDAGFAVGPLPGAVNVRVSEHGVRHPVESPIQREVLFEDELRQPVGREGLNLMGFVHRQLRGLAVDRPARRSEDESLRAEPPAVLENVERPENVYRGVELRLPNGTTNVHLCRMMIHDVGPLSGEELGKLGGTNVELLELGPRIQVLLSTRGQSVDDVGCDEPRPPRNQDLHFSTIVDPSSELCGLKSGRGL